MAIRHNGTTRGQRFPTLIHRRCCLLLLKITLLLIIFAGVTTQKRSKHGSSWKLTIRHHGTPLQSFALPTISPHEVTAAELAEFTEGECCAGAVINSTWSRETVCRFRRSRDLLVRRPSQRPKKFGTTCLAYAHDLSTTRPEYAVLLNVWNTGPKLRVGLTQLLKLTHGPWELIILIDGCEDDSYQVALDLYNRFHSWPKCPYPAMSIQESRVWNRSGIWSVAQGDIGNECWLQPSSLVSIRLINATKLGLHNTAGDNIKMLASRAKYLILVDDDQFMTVNGWNVKAAYPLQRWDDVISASMRCAHTYPRVGGHAGAKCFDTLAVQAHGPSKCVFYVTDSGNRGPLVLRADYVKKLGYLDEVAYMGVVTNGELWFGRENGKSSIARSI